MTTFKVYFVQIKINYNSGHFKIHPIVALAFYCFLIYNSAEKVVIVELLLASLSRQVKGLIDFISIT